MIPHRTIAVRPSDLIGQSSESILKNFIPQPHHYWVGSGRSALMLCIPKDARVGIPAFTCSVVKVAIEHAGATPVFYDSGIISEAAEIETIAHTIDHLLLPYNFGFMPNMKEIMRLCKRHNITLIEDCALALGSEYNGMLAGSFGTAAIWSFNISKNMGFIGGMIGSTEKISVPPLPPYPFALQCKAVLQTLIGQVFFHPAIYSITRHLLRGELEKEHLPLQYALPIFAQRVICNGLVRYNTILQHRRENGEYLMQELEGIIDFVKPINKTLHNWPSFVMMVDDREELMKKLLQEGVEMIPWHTYYDISGTSPKAQQTTKQFLVFETLRPRWQLERFVATVKKVMQ